MKLLRNLEGVRKNKPILKSEVGSLQSIRSRLSRASAKNSHTQTPSGTNDGRLTRIEEIDGENPRGAHCEACNRENITEEDQVMNQDISKQISEEDNIKTAYNEFRNKKGLKPIDFTATPNYQVQSCLECLLECF